MEDLAARSGLTFHIPVMGTGFTIDTLLRVAKYGITPVISLVDDVLIEQIRKLHCRRAVEPCEEIAGHDEDAPARRIPAYLNLVDRLVRQQIQALRASPFEAGSDIRRYYEMLPETPLKSAYRQMPHAIYCEARAATDGPSIDMPLDMRITAQGGIGTAAENELLPQHYRVDGTGWATPFLLVPDVWGNRECEDSRRNLQ
jgi:hypothetical protein